MVTIQTLVMFWILDEVGWSRLMYLRQYVQPANIVTIDNRIATVTRTTVTQSTGNTAARKKESIV